MSIEGLSSRELPRYGALVTIKNRWIRHAQKMSGDVMNTEGTGISSASISEAGRKKARVYGADMDGARDGVKGYVSNSDRTKQTLEEILTGYVERNPGKPIRNIHIREELSADAPDKFMSVYDGLFTRAKQDILLEMGLQAEDFKSLSLDQQESVAERAEEPLVRDWLDNPASELAKLFPPKEAAKRFAKIFSRRHERMAKKLYSESEIDLLHVTHKTITEPFLVSGVLVRVSDGERITRLAQLGQSLQTLGDWESEVTTDVLGIPSVTITFANEKCLLDEQIFQELLT